jgi:hypothetical protein
VIRTVRPWIGPRASAILKQMRAAATWTFLGSVVGVAVPGCGVSPPEPFWVGENLAYGKTNGDAEVCRGSWEVQSRYVGELATLLGAEIPTPIPYTLIDLDEREHYCDQEGVAGCARDGAAYSIHRIHMHELAHVVARQAGVLGPHAFSEGFAEMFGDGKFSTPRRLPIADVIADIEADRGGGYYTAALFVRFLVEEYGLETLLDFMRRTEKDTAPEDYAEAFREVFGTPLEDAFVAFDDYPSCSTMNNRIPLVDCTGDPVPWVDGAWSASSELSCDAPEVVGPIEADDKMLVGASHGLVIDAAGSYRIEVSGSVDGLAGARVNRCEASCWDFFEAQVLVGQVSNLELPAGRYYVTLVRELDQVGDVRVTMTSPT